MTPIGMGSQLVIPHLKRKSVTGMAHFNIERSKRQAAPYSISEYGHLRFFLEGYTHEEVVNYADKRSKVLPKKKSKKENKKQCIPLEIFANIAVTIRERV